LAEREQLDHAHRFDAAAGCFSGGSDGAHLGRSSPSGHLASHASSGASTSFELDVSEQDGSVVVVDVQTANRISWRA